MNKIIAGASIIFIIFSPAFASAYDVWVESPQGVLVNETFTVDVSVSGDEIHGAGFELSFNNTVINALEIAEGEFLKSGGDSTHIFTAIINNTEGTIKFDDSIATHWNDSVSGTGIIATITFRAESSGISKLGVRGTGHVPEILMGPGYVITNVSIQNATVIVSMADISFQSLTIAPDKPVNNQTVFINTLIKNSGNVDADNVKIELLIDNVSVENETINILKYSSNNLVTFSYNFSSGLHNITIRADPGNEIFEFNENNNIISRILMVDIGRVCGNVMDSGTYQPIPGAIINTAAGSTLTNDNGNYCLFLPEGNYTVFATDPSGAHDFHSKNINIINGEITTCDFSLSCGINTGTVCGVVTSKTKLPIINALIEAVNKTGNLRTESTNNSGRYCITLAPGNYTLTVSMENYDSLAVNISMLACLKAENNFELELEPICGDDACDEREEYGNAHYCAIDCPHPELGINKILISNAMQGKNATVSVIANNSGSLPANNTKLALLIDNISIENKTINISKNSLVTVNFTLIFTQGIHNVTVLIDPGNEIPELDESDNSGTETINVWKACDINNDGIILRDYRDLMNAYKCFLGINSYCADFNNNKITCRDWRDMKYEYECFVGG